MTNTDNEKLAPDLQTRRCHKCGNTKMISTSRKLSGFSTESIFACPDCDHEVTLASGGSGGVNFAGAIIVIGVIAFIMWLGKGFSNTELIVLAVLSVLFFAVPILEAVKRGRYPITGVREPDEQEKTNTYSGPSDPIQKGITWLDSFGFVKGFFGLFVLIILWFLFWGILGFVKDTFF